MSAERGHAVVCGGLGGVMEAVCRGANEAGGHTIGILPTERCADANENVDTAIATGMGNARNVLVVMNGDAVVETVEDLVATDLETAADITGTPVSRVEDWYDQFE